MTLLKIGPKIIWKHHKALGLTITPALLSLHVDINPKHNSRPCLQYHLYLCQRYLYLVFVHLNQFKLKTLSRWPASQASTKAASMESELEEVDGSRLLSFFLLTPTFWGALILREKNRKDYLVSLFTLSNFLPPSFCGFLILGRRVGWKRMWRGAKRTLAATR